VFVCDLRIAACSEGDFGWVRSFLGTAEEEEEEEEEETARAAGLEDGGAVPGLNCTTFRNQILVYGSALIAKGKE
jgi:hypothetical protein